MKKIFFNMEHYKKPIVQYGSITDPGGGSGGGSGGGGGGGGGNGGIGDTSACIAAMQSALAGETASISISSLTTAIDSASRYITYTWECYRGLFNSYQYNSVDVGYQQLISGVWQFTSIVHQNVYITGSTGGYVATYIDIMPPSGVVVNPHLASMTLNFKVRGTTYCFGVPIEGDISPSASIASKSFTV
ncbi:hypothetical protein [Pedobacter sp. L105]|uniref:hypothetical protein n=1 Tax=Pedobacter sp. L105 TaxID=1641871 RepID=UPI00131BD9B4|nr:hypothetical protein [Pedobacter sp. L105]